MNGERVTPTTAIIDVGSSILVNSAYLAPPYQVTAIGPKDLYSRLSGQAGFVDFVRARAERFGIRLSFAEPESVDMPGIRRHRDPALRPAGAESVGVDRPGLQRAGRDPGRMRSMRARRSQLTIAAVAFILGLLVVVQLRTQASGAAFAELSSQDLTVLVANLNARNDQLRREIASLQTQYGTLNQNAQRGEVSIDDLRADLRRVRLYAGLDAATGPGVSIRVAGAIDGSAIEDLINELRNAGAEAIAIDGVAPRPGHRRGGRGGRRDGRGHAGRGSRRDRGDRHHRTS